MFGVPRYWSVLGVGAEYEIPRNDLRRNDLQKTRGMANDSQEPSTSGYLESFKQSYFNTYTPSAQQSKGTNNDSVLHRRPRRQMKRDKKSSNSQEAESIHYIIQSYHNPSPPYSLQVEESKREKR